jgi:hypothetical protein
MAKQPRVRTDFVIKDLVVSIPSASAGGGGRSFIPADDNGEPLPWWISPVAGVLSKEHVLEIARETVRGALKDQAALDSIGLAFREGDPDGNPALREAIHDVGSAVVASAVWADLARAGASGGGGVGLPNPDCGGSSLETIPTPITPIVHVGMEAHRIADLPKMRKQLAIAVEKLDTISRSYAPTAAEAPAVRAQLEGALKSLGH